MQLLNKQMESIQPASQHRIVVFELAAGGHHPMYIKHLVRHWHQERLPGTLQVVVSPEFVERHPTIVSMTLETAQSSIQFTGITVEEYAHFKNQKSLISKSFAEWDLFCRYASQLQATYGLLMYFDSLQIPLLLGKKSPCPVAGIYFRPTFHYSEFANYKPTGRDRIRQWRQKWLLRLILRKPQLNTLFCLDPFVIKQIEQFSDRVKVLPLADPVQPHQSDRIATDQLQHELGIDHERTIFLMLGEMNGRKGIHQVCEAIQSLPSAESQRIGLILAGPINLSEKAAITDKIHQVSSQSEAQVIVCDRYIQEAQIQQFYELADVVLATYQRHVGMSSILLHAAAAQTPVIASDFGLMGELVHRYGLGIAVDAEDSSAIARSISEVLEGANKKCDHHKMQQFASQNLVEKFVETLVSDFFSQTQKL